MKTWSTPAPAALPVQPDRLRVFDTASQSLRHPGNDAERALARATSTIAVTALSMTASS